MSPVSFLQRFKSKINPKRSDFVFLALLVIIQILVTLILIQIYVSVKSTTTTLTSSSKEPRILCWILTFNSTENNKKTEAVKGTWAKRCDKYLIVSNGSQLEKETKGANVLRLPIEHEGRDQLWRKVVSAHIYLYENYLEQFDWFMKADDDTYVLVESLRQFLLTDLARRKRLKQRRHQRQRQRQRQRPPPPQRLETRPIKGSQPPVEYQQEEGQEEELLVYYGHRFKPYVEQGYMSGGSGYVLSREALRRLVEFGLEPELADCRVFETANEDVQIGKCLEAVGVEAGDTRDPQGRETFLPLSPSFLLSDDQQHSQAPWYAQYNYYNQPVGNDQDNDKKNCCSSRPISFHYIDPQLMYLIDWLLYDVNTKRNT